MLRKGITAFVASALSAVCLAVALHAAPATLPDAAKAGDLDAVRALLRQGADVNRAEDDGLTALHWAAIHGDAQMAQMLIVAGANVQAKTRLGAYTPLHMAAENGNVALVRVLLAARADVNVPTAVGTTPLMVAAGAGATDVITALVENGANPNAKENERGHTPLMFASANDQLAAVKLLLQRGADPNIATRVDDLGALSRNGGNPDGRNLPANPEARSGGNAPSSGAAQAPAQRKASTAGVDRQYLVNELVNAQGGMTPLHFAARQGYIDVARTLLDAGVNVDQIKAGDNATPLLIATINGHFDLAAMLLERGANPSIASENGVTPLYGALNVQWAPKALYPQPRAHLNQQLGYLAYMKVLLDKGAATDVRLSKKVWYSGYNFDQSGVDEIGATPFWRAAYAGDVEAMKLLVSYGADPNIPTMKPAGRPQTGDGDQRQVEDTSGIPPVPIGGPAVTALQAAAGVGYGEGFAANAHHHAPGGFLPAIKYLVEELHADVNVADHEGNTALHHAAARGDNAVIEYLVSKGANVHAVNRQGENIADMANGPVQRTQPFPETLALLEKLGVKHQNRCKSC